MPLINIYLEETPLTSTKNKLLEGNLKYLEDNFRERFCRSSLDEKLKRKVSSLFESYGELSSEKFLKCSIQVPIEEGYILESEPTLKKRCKRLKHKKKRKSQNVYLDYEDEIMQDAACEVERRSRSRERSLPVDCPDSRAFCPTSPAYPVVLKKRLCAPAGPVFGSAEMTVGAMPTPISSFGFDSPVSSVPVGSVEATGFGTPTSSALFGSSGPVDFSMGKSNFSFGSPGASGFVAPPLSNMLRATPSNFFRMVHQQQQQQQLARIPEIHILKMPSYELDAFKFQEVTEINIFESNLLRSGQLDEKSVHHIRGKKLELLNIVSMALMYSLNLADNQDAYRIILEKLADEVRLFDPEFILKVALYARQELHIRVVTNFLLAYAALHNNTRVYLEKYFDASIVLPSDWIQVAEYFQALKGGTQCHALPAALRRIMKKTFVKFDEYQLAKYNRDKIKKKTPEKQVTVTAEGSAEETDKEKIVTPKKLTLKQLIRTLHIDSPAMNVMCLLGKKYPDSHAAFKTCGLSGTWDHAKAGKRMKLPVPMTWETQISANGNKPSVWESLIDNKKLPYMAMLRNLRNLILSGISPVHHKKAIKYLENKKAVINSRQLPMQFFEAYKAVVNLEKLLEGSGKGPSGDSSASKTVVKWKKDHTEKMQEKIKSVSVSLLEQYKSAISNALEISSLNNLHPIPGKTLIVCEIGPPKKGAKNKAYETCIMMGLMCMRACEDSEMNVLRWINEPDTISLNKNDNFLNVLMKTLQRYEYMHTNSKLSIRGYDDASDRNISSLKRVLDYYLKPQTMLSVKLDHLVLLRTSSDDNASDDADSCMKDVMTSFLHKYRQIVNSNLLYTDVNFSLSNKRFVEGNSSEKDVYLCGSSSSFIKFIAERSSGGQLACVENIDVKYKLPEISESKRVGHYNVSNPTDAQTTVPLNCRVPKWHTVRIFISSTFKDMISERDLLVRYVFPELKKRAASVFIRIAEIDLRWGVTEADSVSKRATEFCLLEAQRSDLLIGLIGERYGSIYEFDPPDDPRLQWVKELIPSGLSITELEIHASALKTPKEAQNKAFFYFRDSSFISHVPQKWVSHFSSEDAESKTKVEALKYKIKSKKFKVFDKYPCHWAGIFEDKPILAGLDVLGNRILEDLWTAVQDIHKADPFCDDVIEEDIYQENLISSQNFYVGKKDSPMDIIINKIKSERGIFIICGTVGSGKTAFCIDMLQSLNNYIVIKYFVGVSPRSRDLSYMIQYICNSIWRHLSVSMSLPDLSHDVVNQFPDILHEAANCTGGKDIILLIDGLDHLEPSDQNLDWLPLILPYNVKVICSASESSQAFKILCDRLSQGDVTSIESLSPLKQSDREQFIRSYIKYYGKTLDESAFGNQMLKIVTKKDSSIPLYLRTVCDFLRMYASFDNLITMLQNLPSTLSLLFQEIILQLENDFGTALIQTSLTLLCISKLGLEHNDLHYVLSFLTSLNEQKTSLSYAELKEKIQSLEPENLLSQVTYCSLLHMISTFAYGQMWRKSFSLIGTEFEKAITKFYVNKNFSANSKYMHSVLAAYYHSMCDPNNDGKYKGQSAFAVRGLLYHMFNGCLYNELNDLLCNHSFLESVFKTKADDELLEYYSSLLFDVLQTNQKVSREIDYNNLFSFYDFVSRNFHILHQYPQLVMQQALNEPSDSLAYLKNGSNFYSLENLSRSHVLDCRRATLCGFVKNITASAGEKRKAVILLGSEDGYLKVLDLPTRKIIHSIKCHASAITSICYAGKKQICTSSADGTLSLWDTENFSRISILEGHRHNVTSCCSDPTGCILFSSGWDNSIRLWSLKDGRSISAIEDFRCPVNCIDHHPTKQELACGLWNGCIEVWDTISMKKKLAFSSSSGSVKSIAYTPDGINIISAFMQSEISVWSSEEGLKISSLKGHVLPVKALSYSYEDSMFISGSDDCTLKVWSTVSGSNLCTVTECKFCSINLMEFMSENLLAVAFQNSDIWIIDINSGIPTNKFTLKSDMITSFSKYSLVNVENQDSSVNWFEQALIFGTQSGKLMIANLLDSSIARRDEMDSKVTALTHNYSVILCGSAEGDIGVFSYPENTLSKVVHGAHTRSITAFSFTTKDEKLFACSASFDNVLKFWSIDSNPELNKIDVSLEKEVINKHKDNVTCSVFYSRCTSCDVEPLRLSSLGNSVDLCDNLLSNLITGSHDNNIISWNESPEKIFKGLQSSVVNIACSDDFVLGCGNDGAVVLWSKTGKVVASIPRIELSSATLAFHITEDNLKKFVVTLAFVEQDGSITVSRPFQKTYNCSLEGHNKPITSCCTAENGEIVSCSLDGTVNLWRVPTDAPEFHLVHSSSVTGVILSAVCDFALSSDAHGNLILWKIDFTSSSSPLVYGTKKNYVGGFIRGLSWLKDNKFVCAVSQVINNEEKHFINVLSFEHCTVSEKETYSMRLENSHMFVSEVMCLDSCPSTDVIVIGLKSGDVAVITSEGDQLIHMCDDWLLGICLYSRLKTSDYFCVSFIDGTIQLYAVADFMTSGFWGRPDAFATYKSSESCDEPKIANVICCGNDSTVCCGDMQGVIKIYVKHSLKFTEKIHTDSITGICIIGPYLFTSSLDRTVKGWKLSSFKQVFQFHSHVPITCLDSPKIDFDASDSNCHLLLLGTTSGDVHLLKFHCQ